MAAAPKIKGLSLTYKRMGGHGQRRGCSNQELQKVKKVQFLIYSKDEIIKNAVCEVNSTLLYDKVRGLPAQNGVNDPRMGVSMRSIECQTCFGTIKECPGHFGYMTLKEPVYNVEFLSTIHKVLKSVCSSCSKLLLTDEHLQNILRIRNKRRRLIEIAKAASPRCEVPSELNGHRGCGMEQRKYMRKKLGISSSPRHNDGNSNDFEDSKRDLLASEALKIFSRIDDDTIRILGFDKTYSHPKNMILEVLIVAPPAIRPSIEMSATGRAEDDLTHSYQTILATNLELTKAKEGGYPQTKITEMIERLQANIAYFMNNNENKARQKGGRPIKSISQRLKGKEGRLRGNLMGKRVDFSARTVVSPDPSLELDQLGVPEEIASEMTIPETVTQLNIDWLKKLVEQKDEWPGARYYISKVQGNEILDLKHVKETPNLQYGDVVERHLMNDDYVMFNRQPSLHKMSLMGHRVRVLPGKTFRLNLAVTTPYNADFDGDEMNMHAPQTLETKAEVKHLMHVPRQMVTPQSNRPVMGLNQDALLSIRLFSFRDCFLTRDQVYDLIMQIDDFDGNLPRPAILKPAALWTGKQILSLVLPKINYYRYVEDDVKKFYLNDDSVIIRRGELLSGILNKSNVGPTRGSLIGCIWIDFGPEKIKDFLSYVQKIVNNWMLFNGFSVGISDTIISPELVQRIEELRAQAKNKFLDILKDTQLKNKKIITHQPGKTIIQSFEIEVNKELNNCRGEIGKLLKDNVGNENNIKRMILAGSKGSDINISQIAGLVGQQNVEGQRIKQGFQRRTLPHFLRDDYGLESRGFVSNSYYRGLTPEEFFFHTMGGREGLIDTAVKTSQSGYMQRRLVKALEDVMVQYDSTVRDSHGNIVQFVYGEDGIAGEFIEEQKFDMLDISDDLFRRKCCFFDYDPASEDFGFEESINRLTDEGKLSLETREELLRGKESYNLLLEEYWELLNARCNLRTKFQPGQALGSLPVNIDRLINSVTPKTAPSDSARNAPSNLSPVQVIRGLNDLVKGIEIMNTSYKSERATEVAKMQNEAATFLFKVYLKYRLCSRKVLLEYKLSQETFNILLQDIALNFNRARAQPGEMAGSIAAQSIGETLTQMTLNTFHFAGVSEKNVTLGVPRIQEIINCSRNIKGPSMTVFLEPGAKFQKDQAASLMSLIEYTTLSQVAVSSEIFFDPVPNQTVIPEDQDLIFIEDDLGSCSPWILRICISQYLMALKLVKLQDILEMVTSNYSPSKLHLTSSLETAEPIVLRLRLLQQTKNDYAEIKKVEQHLLQDTPIKGFCRKVSFVQKKVRGFTANGVEIVGDKAGEFVVETLGTDLRKILSLPLVDKRRCISNDIFDIYKTFGVEAARTAIVREVKFQLENFGISVNSRHLALLADTITANGSLMSISRNGINRVYSSPFRKCSFEETVDILIEAAVFADSDYLKGVTENIMLGQLCHMGTGAFDILMDKFYILPSVDQRETVTKQWRYFPDLNPIVEVDEDVGDDKWSKTVETPFYMANTPMPHNSYQTLQTPRHEGFNGMLSPPPMSPGRPFDSSWMGRGATPTHHDFKSPKMPGQFNQGLGGYRPGIDSPLFVKKEHIQSPVLLSNRLAGNMNNSSAQLVYMASSPQYGVSPANMALRTGRYGASISPTHQQLSSSPMYSPNSNESPQSVNRLGPADGQNGSQRAVDSPFAVDFHVKTEDLFNMKSPSYAKAINKPIVKKEENYSEDEEDDGKA